MDDSEMPKKKNTTFFLQTDYLEQNKAANGQNQFMAENILGKHPFEKDEGHPTLSLELNKLRNKSQLSQSSNAFVLGVITKI